MDLTTLFDTYWAVYAALLLGLMTAISPCPLATNISAIGYLSRSIDNKKLILLQSFFYILGRTVVYVGIAVIIKMGADVFEINLFLRKYGGKIIGPLLIIVGVFMLDFIKINMPIFSKLSMKAEEKSKSGSLISVFLLGVVFALAFCPSTAFIYFGLLIPQTLIQTEPFTLPLVFSIAAALPVVLFVFLIVFTVSAAGKLYNNIKSFEFWFRRAVSIIFIIAGIYLVYQVYFSMYF